MQSDYGQQRTKMVDCQIRTTDVVDVLLLDAMGTVPREDFVDDQHRDVAYIDEDLKLIDGAGGAQARYLMEPSPFARLVQLAAVNADETVLDVGCATGYSSAVLSLLAKSVVGLESDDGLAGKARENTARLGYSNVTIVTGPLASGHAARSPYDVILIEGAVDEVPETLFQQMRDGGRLLAVVGTGHAARARVYVKDDGVVTGRSAFNAAVKPLPGFERAEAFQF